MYELTLPRHFAFVNTFFEDFLSESDDPLNLEIEVPGIAAKDITINLENNHLIVKGETGNKTFYKSYLVSKNINPEQIEAKYEHGLLTLSAPVNHKKIEIKLQNTAQ